MLEKQIQLRVHHNVQTYQAQYDINPVWLMNSKGMPSSDNWFLWQFSSFKKKAENYFDHTNSFKYITKSVSSQSSDLTKIFPRKVLMATMTINHLKHHLRHTSTHHFHGSVLSFTMRVQYWWPLEAENVHELVRGDAPPLDPLSLVYVLLEQSARCLGIKMA